MTFPTVVMIIMEIINIIDGKLICLLSQAESVEIRKKNNK